MRVVRLLACRVTLTVLETLGEASWKQKRSKEQKAKHQRSQMRQALLAAMC